MLGGGGWSFCCRTKASAKSKRIQKRLGKKIKPKDLIPNATNNLNKTSSIKYGFMHNQAEEKSLEDNSFLELYNFHRLARVKDDEDRVVRYK